MSDSTSNPLVQDVNWNERRWDGAFTACSEHTAEVWSKPWGISEAQWNMVLWPRLTHFLPVNNLLEIAPGGGRWTRFLLQQCRNYIGVDLSNVAVETCQARFAYEQRATFFHNDGVSLDMVPSQSADFIFSFDSLVHAEMDAVAAYIEQFPRILSPRGVAFIHHSNMAEFGPHTQTDTGLRALSVSADLVRQACEQNGLHCLVQEKINWRRPAQLSDCITVISRSVYGSHATPRVVANDQFEQEREICLRLFDLYRLN